MSIMVRKTSKRSLLTLCLISLFFAWACCTAPPYRAHPEFETRVKKINHIALLPPVVEVYEVSPSGMAELRDDWCVLGRKSLEKALVEELEEKRYVVHNLTTADNVDREVKQIQALFKQVNKSVQLHSYGPQVFNEKMRNFEYGLGSLEKVMEACGTDSMVFVTGFDQVSPQRPKTYISMAMVDTSGTILWYCVKGSRGKHQLKDPVSSAMLVEDILSSFPKRVE